MTAHNTDRQQLHPLFGPNKLKLGVFGYNGPGVVHTTHPDKKYHSWREARALSQLIDNAGLEAIVPYSRWRGFGTGNHISGHTLDPLSFAAANAATTQNPAVFSTLHTTNIHPLIAAKQAATIDDISDGRFAMNVVAGWYPPDMAMFGAESLDHSARYAQAAEWITIVKRLWAEEDGFDFAGEYFDLKDLVMFPKPVRSPRPPIMSAGSSPDGRKFAAEHADVVFILLNDSSPENVRERVELYKDQARRDYGREVQVWTYVLVVQRDSKEQAQAAVDLYVGDYGDSETIDTFMRDAGKNHKEHSPELLTGLRESIATGGGLRVYGNDQDIAEQLIRLSDGGVDGCLLTFVDYQAGIQRFTDTVIPLLEEQGLRQPVAAQNEAVQSAGVAL